MLTAQESGGATLHQDLAVHFHNNQVALGDELSCGNASTFILAVNGRSSKNGRSLVLAIEHHEFTVIFTGDAEGSTEQRASLNYGRAIKATVLSGSHHGASTNGGNGKVLVVTGRR